MLRRRQQDEHTKETCYGNIMNEHVATTFEGATKHATNYNLWPPPKMGTKTQMDIMPNG